VNLDAVLSLFLGFAVAGMAAVFASALELRRGSSRARAKVEQAFRDVVRDANSTGGLGAEAADYTSEMGRLTSALSLTTERLSVIAGAIARLSAERAQAADAAELRMRQASQKEAQATARVATLAEIPIPIVDAFTDVVRESDRRGTWRDISLFVAGMIFTTIISVIVALVVR
jgi:hypothetical protein